MFRSINGILKQEQENAFCNRPSLRAVNLRDCGLINLFAGRIGNSWGCDRQNELQGNN